MSDQTEDAQKAYKKAKEHGLQQLFTSLTPQLLLPPQASTSHSTTTNMPYTNNTNTTTSASSSNNISGMKRAAPV